MIRNYLKGKTIKILFIVTYFTTLLLSAQQTPFNGPHNVPGTIESEDFDNGGQDISYHDNEVGTNPGAVAAISDYRKVNGVTDPDVEVLSGAAFSNGQKVGWMSNGDWLEYTFNAAKVENDDYIIKVRVTSTTAANGDNKGYKLLLDGVDISGNVKVNPAGGFFSQFLEIETETKIVEGEHVLRLEVFTTVGQAIDLDSMQFISKAESLKASLSVTRLINNNSVLQRNTQANIWGKGEPGNEVTIDPQWGDIVKTTIEPDGNWSAKIPTPDVGGSGPYTLNISDSTKSFSFSDILLGEVWLCSGQSNMDATLNSAWAPIANKATEVANSTYNDIRFFKVSRGASYTEQTELQNGAWQKSNPTTARNFSAVAYFFARDLYLALDNKVPIGVIVAAKGNSSGEAWTTSNSLIGVTGFETIVQDLQAAETATANQDPSNPYNGKYKISHINNDGETFRTPGTLYNSMIHPVIPYTIKGATWYQGESNSGSPTQYIEILPALIKEWRNVFNNPDLSFYTVQLTTYQSANPWYGVREAQFLTKAIANTGVAVTLDLGQANEIHPPKKQEIGQRLSFLALANDYGKDIVSSGPIYESAEFKDGKGILTFSSIGSGLKLVTGDANLFEIAGSDNVFRNATAVIVGDKLEVSAASVTNPTQVRYAWKNWIAKPVLYNNEDIPASSFRTNPPLVVEPNPDLKKNAIFTIKSIGETCASSNNGKINIVADKIGNYIATVLGKDESFTKEITLNDYDKGVYNLQIVDQSNNKVSEFEITIAEPEDLTVNTNVVASQKKITLEFDGGNSYTVNLNGKEFKTIQEEIVLDLEEGKNSISVKADKDCQGEFKKIISIGDQPIVFPSPVKDFLTVDTRNNKVSNTEIHIYDVSGKLVSSKKEVIVNQIKIDTRNFTSGVYFVEVTIDNKTTLFKITK